MSDTQPLVLVIEDEVDVRTFARIALAAHGYRMAEASTAAEGLRQAATYRPDVVLLDLGLPDADGSEVTRRLREWTMVPILVISARSSEDAKVKALDQGADDYMTKPFGAAELMARIRVALRNAARLRGEPASVVHIGEDIRLDLEGHTVLVRGSDVHLTPIEFRLLAALVRHAGMVMTHGQLLQEVWGPGCENEMQYLRVYMMQLRHKLERRPARPKYLLTEPGIGYRLRIDS
jgi:two-component system KDP operon response regulator KdpE